MKHHCVLFVLAVGLLFGTSTRLLARDGAVIEQSEIEAGRRSDFGYARRAKKVGDLVHLSFDRANLLTGEKAIAYSRAKGMGDDVPNDYIIANDNPKLRNLVLAPSVVITGTGVLANGSVEPKPVTLAAFIAALQRYDDGIPVNITYDKQRRVVKIAEPFFP
jgi:hypothetical protein